MKNIAIFILILLFVISDNTVYVFCQSLPADMINRIKSATVYIEAVHNLPLEDKEYKTSGTGFFISKNGYILTNYHVIDAGVQWYDLSYPTIIKKIRVIRNSGTSAYRVDEAIQYAVDPLNDLAILAIKDTASVPFLFPDTSAVPVETLPVWIFGFPFGDAFSVIQRGPEITIVKGSIAALRHNDLDQLVSLQIEAEVNPGNSGGPVVNEKGDVIGVINIALRNINMNFAVPAWYYYQLAGNDPLSSGTKDNPVMVTVTSTPPSSGIFIDNKYEGVTPTGNITLSPGVHSVYLIRDGFYLYQTIRRFSEGENFTCDLKPVQPLIISTGAPGVTAVKYKPAGPAGLPVPRTTGTKKLLMEENFNDPEKFRTWEQSTGGTDVRTWYLEENMLHQHESNGTLHAIYLGERSWKNYDMNAAVKINNEEGDSRAGLIFRENESGFYLFRIHRQTDKAQLAYHCKEPFGWFILGEKKLESDLSGNWYDLGVFSNGNAIACTLDNIPVFTAPSTLSSDGRVGFYSVESFASFDSLAVYEWEQDIPSEKPETEEMISFWFSDNFNTKSNWWYTYSGDRKPDQWIFTGSGLLQNNDDEQKRYCEFIKYHLDDFVMNVVITPGKGKDNSEFEFFFRKNGTSLNSVLFSADKNTMSLYSVNGNDRKLIKSGKPVSNLFSKTFLLTVKVDGNIVSCAVSNRELFIVKSNSVRAGNGTFGFSTGNLKLVLHQLNVTSINNDNPVK
ncbi:MAG: trypsin-like peptidase domain-containing protein [Bacteroidetes bacterium]|nr:trypsin-like peptidase domain-containing protein [Bacteroidota bacterium]